MQNIIPIAIQNIKLHFVIAVKYRKRLLVGELNDDMLKIVRDICNEYGYIIDEMQSDIDHLHFLLDIAPKHSPLSVIHKIKQLSTYRIIQNISDSQIIFKKEILERKYILV